MVTAPMHEAVGEIRPDLLYRLEQLKRVAGIGDGAIRSARRKGLRVIYKNRAAWVLGADFISYITRAD